MTFRTTLKTEIFKGKVDLLFNCARQTIVQENEKISIWTVFLFRSFLLYLPVI